MATSFSSCGRRMTARRAVAVLSVLLILLQTCTGFTEDKNYAADGDALTYVTYGSLLKLKHAHSSYRLHSHEVSYGSGSSQQSVTGFANADDNNSFWLLKEAHGTPVVPQGTPVKHGDKFRLQHIQTGKNLHTHHHRAPLSTESFEVSCFGQNGNGDEADNWALELPGRSGYWKRGENVRIKHIIEGTYLASHSKKYNRPIEGQLEIVAVTKKSDTLCNWKSAEGVFFEAIFPNDEE